MDQVKDSNAVEFYRITKLYEPPEFVKAASSEELRGAGNLPRSAFADPIRELFPLHTKAAVWTSFAFFQQNRGLYKKADDAQLVESRIVRAARELGLTKELKQLKEASDANRPADDNDLSDDDFAVILYNEGVKERHMPMRNALEVKKAAEYLQRYRNDFVYNDRRAIADRILQKVAQYGAALGDKAEFLEKVAGYGACTAKEAVQAILTRVSVSRRGPGSLTPLQTDMLKLAEIFEEKPAQLHEPGMRVKLAGVMDSFDRAVGLTHMVREGKLDQVEDVIFHLTGSKMASAQKEHTSTITGNIYKLADVERLKLDDIRELLGDEIARSVTADGLHVNGEKAAEVIPTLPRGDAALLDSLMGETGLAPVAKEASAQAVQLERSFLQEIAKRYQPNT